MKLMNVMAAAAVLFVGAAHADMVEVEGIIAFDKGNYQLVSVDNTQTLTGLSLDELRAFEGTSVVISGEMTDKNKLEIYKVQQSVQGEMITAYDWDLVDAELYEN